MRSSFRGSGFFVAAVLLHAGLLALLPRHRPQPPPKVEDALLWIEPQEPSARSVPGTNAAAVVEAIAPRTTGAATGGEATSPSGSGTGTEPATASVLPASSASSAPLPTLFVPDRAGIGLEGVGSYRVSAAREGEADAGPPETEAQRLSDRTREAIVGPLRAHDLANGGFGGPAVVAVEDTARHGLTPNFGRAVFAIEVDALGMVIGVGVEDAPQSDRRQWEEIAAQSRTALAQKRLHLPPGAKGAHIRVEVTSRIQMPSGSSRPLTVTSPVVEGASKLGSGEKAEDAAPIIRGSFDLSDIGAHPLRVVGARELSENVY